MLKNWQYLVVRGNVLPMCIYSGTVMIFCRLCLSGGVDGASGAHGKGERFVKAPSGVLFLSRVCNYDSVFFQHLCFVCRTGDDLDNLDLTRSSRS